MLLYHGTASTYLPSIQKLGLKPSKARNFQVETQSGNRVPPTHRGVYLTTSRETAEAFATLRASYLNARPGEHVNFPLYNAFYKSYDAPDPVGDAKPIVLEIRVDDNTTLHIDEEASSVEAYWHPGSIPASAIVKVDTL